MEIDAPFVNRVAASGLITLDLSSFYDPSPRMVYDLRDNLFQDAILKEKDFREFLKDHDWTCYQGAHVVITCSVEAIIPSWAYMLLAVYMGPYAKTVTQGSLEMQESWLFQTAMAGLDVEPYRDQRVVVKGCADVDIPLSAYIEITQRLRPIVKSLSFGEPCSTVPVYKSKAH